MLPGAVWRSDGLDWNAPPNGLTGRLAAGLPTGTSRQATTFRKTRRTDNPAWRLGTVATRPG